MNKIPCKDCITLSICKGIAVYPLSETEPETFVLTQCLSAKCPIFKKWFYENYKDKASVKPLAKIFSVSGVVAP
jgi:hypothetical protein